MYLLDWNKMDSIPTKPVPYRDTGVGIRKDALDSVLPRKDGMVTL